MKCKIVDGEIRERYLLHSFVLYDCDDPQTLAAGPIYEWQQTPAGKFCMEKATELEFHTQTDFNTMGYRIAITGYVLPKHATFLALKKG
jgi:hypothetical protein